MAKFDDIGSGSLGNFGQIISSVAISSFDRLVRGMVFELMSKNVNDFNLMNHDFMNFHMFRNAYEKQVTLSTLGENAYTDGNPEMTATPAQYPTYTKGNNYMEFITNTREAERNGVLVTRVQKAGEENTNLYWDADPEEITDKVEFTGSFLDRNSILYKTKKLMRQQKLKTIISEFHTKGVEYNGQVGSEYGESHGRNLLTKEAENGSNDYSVNGYDNPYCRVWTHHYKYDTISKTMRANSDLMNHWEGFEWNDTDKGHTKDETKYGDGENYDYAWRGEHNQTRREVHSVLDTKTGLVKITPQYRGGGETNRHTKDCMFSIENLAWKDYDPYSFERALSWEQRGPLGGRIMWFPPYGIKITETASARWNSNEFIGRGEPVYTYVNSERTGQLSFMMITDHPSSIDYASWWDDNNLIKGIDNGQGNSENDYLRYFAGCNDDNGLIGETKNDPNDSKTGGLIVKPTPLTDEYIEENPAPLIKKELISPPEPEPEPPQPKIEEDKAPVYVEFFVFFPNNYSGVWDKPTKQDSVVNAIAYLLGGSNTMKQDQNDIPFDISSSGFNFENSTTIGYEMKKGPITTDLVYELNEYIQGGKMNTKEYVPDPEKKWCYRIDHKQPYTGGNDDPKNTINQAINKVNLKDTKTNKTNLVVNSTIESHAQHKDSLYSFAEVAAALYSENILNQPILYQYLIDCGVNVDNVNKLIDLFTNNNQKLTEILCEGAASSHGTKDRNNALSINRANTILNWVRTNTVGGWDKLENTWDGAPKIIPVDAKDKNNINGDSAKMGRCAHCVMTFTSGFTQPTNEPLYFKQLNEVTITADKTENRNIVGFRFKESKVQPNGEIWDYYEKDGSITYYDQKAGSIDNYDNPEIGDIITNETKIIDIFNILRPELDTISNKYIYNWKLAAIVDKCAAVLCYTRDKMVSEISGNAKYVFNENTDYSCVWKYGETNGLITQRDIDDTSNLYTYASGLEPASRPDSTAPNPKIKFTEDENRYLELIINKQYPDYEGEIKRREMIKLRTYIILYRVLDCIDKIINDQGTRNVCETAAETEDEMELKTTRIDESETEGCPNIWVDRGDGLLIQECNINRIDTISRFNPETGEGEWNKLRYDQEYHFYKQWIADHPLMFEKLQEKIKYFNPAFHSMTPEGFNARCTFLQQCTRQGNTKTMSDSGGRTANNLAFGRPPYCVLRLGDFYNQMIVIDSVTFDFNVSDGIQWDLNTEGNGVQPMLCEVSINFKFIGGGDITGPVQRLQNAMSFNYYANTSFYDNRADRVEYQPTNWKTMGGAGNDNVDLEKSYAYIAKNYETQKPNIVTHD